MRGSEREGRRGSEDDGLLRAEAEENESRWRRDKETGCWGSTLTLTVEVRGDDELDFYLSLD